MLVLTVSGFSSVHTHTHTYTHTHTHTHTHVLSCSQAHAHSLTPLTLFAGVFCVSSSCWLCKGAHALTVVSDQMSDVPLTQDKVGERGNYGVLVSVYNWYYHLKWVSCDHLRLHMDLTWFLFYDHMLIHHKKLQFLSFFKLLRCF